MERTVLVTGGSSGIGRATARAFREEDWTVYATAREPEDLEALRDAGYETAEVDVTRTDDCEQVVERVMDEQGRIDCLVNNAGYGQHGPLEDVPVDLLRTQFDVNVFGPHRLNRAVLPHMRDRGNGTIVTVSSLAARLVTPGMGAYAGSKAAVEAMSDALRNEVGPHGVDVAIVEPGPVETQFRDRVEDEIDRLNRTDAYAKIYELQEDASLIAGESSPFAVSPGAVAAVILEAASSPDPDPRYPVGNVAKYALYTRYLPDRMRDSLFSFVRAVT